MNTRIFGAVIACCLPLMSSAVPLQFTHQARLLDADGVPINGDHSVEVRLYDVATNSTPVWDEAQTVSIQDGYFSMILGADPADPLDTDVIIDGGSLWVGLSVDSGPEFPIRTPVGSSMYAMRADISTSLEGGTVEATDVSALSITSGSMQVNGNAAATGSVQVGNGGSGCSTGDAGTVRYADGVFQGCDGAGNWLDLGQQDTNTDTDTLPTGGSGISVTGSTVSIDTATEQYRKRIERYHSTCVAHARTNYAGYETVAAVTPGDSTVALTGTQVCAAYVGNNSRDDFVCIGVPYVYGDVNSSNGNYFGTDVRPDWSSCATVRGNGSYPWVDPVAKTGVMMACCVNPN